MRHARILYWARWSKPRGEFALVLDKSRGEITEHVEGLKERVRHRGAGPPRILAPRPTTRFYNIFDYYFPLQDPGTSRYGLGSRGQESLYREFANVPAGDDAVLAFLRKTGQLGLARYTPPQQPIPSHSSFVLPEVVGPLSPDVLLAGMPESIATIRQHQRTLRAVMSMLTALQNGEGSALQQLPGQLVYPSPYWPYVRTDRVWRTLPAPQTLDAAAEAVAVVINSFLLGVRPCTHRGVDGWDWAWQLRSLLDGFYLMLFLDLQGPGHWQACPACTRIFRSSDTDYCSPRCQNTAKVRRYRESLGKRKGGVKRRSDSTSPRRHT